MKLSEFIRTNLDLILDEWDRFAKNIPAAAQLNITALRDHASGILLAIADDLDQSQTLQEQSEKSKGRGPPAIHESFAEMHATNRVSEGFNVSEAMSEYRALRASVLRLWRAARTPDISTVGEDELTRFNEAIDQALAESLVRYTQEKERSSRLFNTLLSSSPDLNYIVDINGRMIYANTSLARLYKLSPNDLIGKNIFDLGLLHVDELGHQLHQVIVDKEICRGEMTCRLAEHQTATYEYLLVPVMNETGAVEAVAGTARDMTERKAAEEKIRHSANYDFLTGLPNRSYFRDRLDWAVKHSSRTGLPIALFFIDLDDFKEVNDRLGHDAGDQLLQQAARRIASCVRETDTIARIGGDEFTVILTEINKIAHVEILAGEILSELNRSFLIRQKDVHVSGSIGITLYPQDASSPEDLVRNADQAMYVAKNSGRNRFSFYTLGMRDSAWARLKVIDELRQALPRHQLAVYYQPIIDLGGGALVKAEALLRWNHPDTGLMLPAEFIGLAEETGLIGEIGDWVLGEAMHSTREWSAMLGVPFQISVNKSPVEFMSKVLRKNWELQLADAGSTSGGITVEITEGVLLNDSPAVRTKLDILQKAGVQLSIDDFGTGYSSMTYLMKFDVDYLKIDQSFVHDMSTSAESRVVVETIIAMAHKLGLKVIAEGVETAEQNDWLKAEGCDYAQGFFFSAAVSQQDFLQMLKLGDKRPRAAS